MCYFVKNEDTKLEGVGRWEVDLGGVGGIKGKYVQNTLYESLKELIKNIIMIKKNKERKAHKWIMCVAWVNH